MQARLYIRVKLGDGGHHFLDPVYSANSKLKQSYAVVDGKPTYHAKATYYLRYLRNGKRTWESVGPDAVSATNALRKRNAILNATDADVEVVETAIGTLSGRPLATTVDEYLTEVEAAKARKTYLAYTITLEAFRASCKAKTLEEINRASVLGYISALKKQGVSPRTIANRLIYLKTFFFHYGLAWPLLKTDRVKYTAKTVEAYNHAELQSLFAAANTDETDLFQFLLCTGVREQEAAHAVWSDVDFARSKYKVTEKLDLGFTPKDKEEGGIPIPDSLIARLEARRKRYPRSRLIFGRPDGSADGHMLRTLQLLAYRAGLNCGCCYSKAGHCCADKPICHHWGLHKFRKTFATMHHEAGVSAHTIQRWLRHSELDTTLRYLAGSDDQSERTRTQVNSSFAEVAA